MQLLTRFRAWPLAAALLLAPALGACQRNETLLTVQANAVTRATPDLAIVTLGVTARGASASAAQQAQTTRMNAVMDAVRAAGIAEEDVQTVGFSLDPQYAYPRNQAPRITSYQSTNIVAIRVKDLNAISGLIDATVADGANQLHGIQFTYQDEEASRDTARAKAVETARARADAYAEAADMRVARVVSITEPGAETPSWSGGAYNYSMRASGLMEAQAAAISPGQIDNQSSVTVVFELR